MNKKHNLFLNTLLGMFLSYIVIYILHGYAHSCTAWWYGLDDHPWILNHSSLWLQNVTENAGLTSLYQEGNYYTLGLIGLAGYCMNWILIWVALLRLRVITSRSSIEVCFFYWLFVWSLAATFNYIPHHMFAAASMMSEVFDNMGISSVWLFYVAGGAGALCMIFILFYALIFKIFKLLAIHELSQRRIYFTITIMIVFFYNGFHYGWQHLGILATSVGIFIWLKLAAFVIMFYTINLKRNKNE